MTGRPNRTTGVGFGSGNPTLGRSLYTVALLNTPPTERLQSGDSVDASHIEREWYIVEPPPGPRGWLVFSEDAVLRVLQKKRESHEPVQRTLGWRFAAGVIRGLLGLMQALIMLNAWLPVMGQFLESTLTHYPRGSIGFFMRAAYWKTRLRRLGQDTLLDRGVEIWGPANVEIGSGCHLDNGVRLSAGEAGFGQHGSIVIGDYTHIGPRCLLSGRGGLKIGKLVSLQAGVHVYSATNEIVRPREPGKLLSMSHTAPLDLQHTVERPISIEDYCSVGYDSIVLPGVTLGRGCVVHPFCQVMRSFPAFANVAGPGRARQNGWRRPLRADPRRNAAASEGVGAGGMAGGNVASAGSAGDDGRSRE